MSDLVGYLLLVILLQAGLLLPLYEATRLYESRRQLRPALVLRRLASPRVRHWVDVFHFEYVVSDLANIEHTFGNRIDLAKDHARALTAQVLPYNGRGLEHASAHLIGQLPRNHPGRSQLRALPNVDLGILLDSILPTEILGVDREPAIGPTDNRDRWRCLAFWYFNFRGAFIDPHVVRGAVLIELVPID